MAYSFIRSTTKRAAGSAATTITTTAIETFGADFFIAVGGVPSPPSNPFSDSKSNTWVSCGVAGNGVAYFCRPSSVSSSGVADHTFTFNPGVGNPSMVVLAFSGSVASPLDQFSYTAGSPQAGSITPSQANCLVVAFHFVQYTNTAASIDSPFGGTEVNALGNGDTWECGAAYEIQTAATARNPTWTFADISGQQVGIVSFKAAAGGGGGATAVQHSIRVAQAVNRASTY